MSQLDGNSKEEAVKTATAALQLARKHVTEQVIPIIKTIVSISENCCEYEILKFASVCRLSMDWKRAS